MKKQELLARIEQLETRVTKLENALVNLALIQTKTVQAKAVTACPVCNDPACANPGGKH